MPIRHCCFHRENDLVCSRAHAIAPYPCTCAYAIPTHMRLRMRLRMDLHMLAHMLNVKPQCAAPTAVVLLLQAFGVAPSVLQRTRSREQCILLRSGLHRCCPGHFSAHAKLLLMATPPLTASYSSPRGRRTRRRTSGCCSIATFASQNRAPCPSPALEPPRGRRCRRQPRRLLSS